jgi:predicted ATPase
VRALDKLVGDRRLVTLTGPGGSGKTRLARRVASIVVRRFPDGVHFVAADTITEARLLPSTIASALGIREEPGRSVGEAVTGWLREREVLLVVDNLEQVPDAGPFIHDLLSAGAATRVLATSRAPLGVPGEQEFPVPPFPIPQPDEEPSVLEGSDAIRLFIDRARLVRPGFTPDPTALRDVAEICRRLDGLPLAIELVAARVRLMPPAAVRQRLGDRLDARSSSAIGVPSRQQSLREAIGWSQDLLGEADRALFRRLSVFVGGCALDGADDVAGFEPVEDVLVSLGSLVSQSLVRADDVGGRTRFSMLSTIHEFAGEQLELTDETSAVRARHATHFRRLAEGVDRASDGPDAEALFERATDDLDNLRAAIERATDQRDLSTALAIAGALERFWLARNHSAEGRQLLARLLSRSDLPRGPELARAAAAAGSMDNWLGDYDGARRWSAVAVDAYRELGDRPGLIAPLTALGFASVEADPELALRMFDEALATAAGLDAVGGMGRVELGRTVALFRLGRLSEALESVERGRRLVRKAGDVYFATMYGYVLARIRLRSGEPAAAMQELRATIEESRRQDLRMAVAVGLDNYAEMAVLSGDIARGVRLAATAARMKDEMGGGPPASLIGDLDPFAVGREQLLSAEYERQLAAGRAMDPETAVAEALAIPALSEPAT